MCSDPRHWSEVVRVAPLIARPYGLRSEQTMNTDSRGSVVFMLWGGDGGCGGCWRLIGI